MSDPNDTTPPDVAVPPEFAGEFELAPFQADEFHALYLLLRRGAVFGRVVSGVLVLLAVALVRLQHRVGHPVGHLGLFAIASLVASGVIFTMTFGLARSGRAAEAITTTTGRDVSHLMEAMRGLLAVFRVLFATLLAVAALALVVLVVHLAHHRP